MLNATVGVCDDLGIFVVSFEKQKILGSMIIFTEIMHMNYMSLSFNLSFHSSLFTFHPSLFSPFSTFCRSAKDPI